jgi:hypothetical protein
MVVVGSSGNPSASTEMGICVVIVFERSFSGGVSTVSEYVS